MAFLTPSHGHLMRGIAPFRSVTSSKHTVQPGVIGYPPPGSFAPPQPVDCSGTGFQASALRHAAGGTGSITIVDHSDFLAGESPEKNRGRQLTALSDKLSAPNGPSLYPNV